MWARGSSGIFPRLGGWPRSLWREGTKNRTTDSRLSQPTMPWLWRLRARREERRRRSRRCRGMKDKAGSWSPSVVNLPLPAASIHRSHEYSFQVAQAGHSLPVDSAGLAFKDGFLGDCPGRFWPSQAAGVPGGFPGCPGGGIAMGSGFEHRRHSVAPQMETLSPRDASDHQYRLSFLTVSGSNQPFLWRS